MRKIRDATVEEVSKAYMAQHGVVPGEEFDRNDPRHPRWFRPVVPEDPSAKSGLEMALDAIGAKYDVILVPGGVDLLYIHAVFQHSPRWPDEKGLYGLSVAPQYCIRYDANANVSLDTIISRVREKLSL